MMPHRAVLGGARSVWIGRVSMAALAWLALVGRAPAAELGGSTPSASTTPPSTGAAAHPQDPEDDVEALIQHARDSIAARTKQWALAERQLAEGRQRIAEMTALAQDATQGAGRTAPAAASGKTATDPTSSPPAASTASTESSEPASAASR
jgi:hypothetical protein